MLKKNEEYIVDIIDNGFQGEGIAKIDGITVFIDQAIKGEKIKIKILKVQTNFAYGKILEIIEKSNNRTDEDCSTYKRCGGCNLRHIKYEETLSIKKAVVENCMYKALKREVQVNDVIGMENPLYYRNKLQYPVGIDKEQNVIMGVYSSRTHNIIPTEECFIQNKECQIIANDIFKFIKENDISAYNEETLKGTIRHIIIRIGVKTNEVLVTLVLNDNNLKKEKELAEFLSKKHKNIKSIVKNFNTKNTNVILGDKTEVIYGDGYIYDILGDYKFKISPLSFYQVNPVQTEILYNTAINSLDNKNNDIALDLYCGIGTIGIFASKYFKKVYGIEIVEQAIEDAKYNAKINNIDNIEFFAGDVEKILPKIIERDNIKPNVVFVDPPRKGLDKKTIGVLQELEPSKIIYISCNPATLARDISLLEEKYELKSVQPVDMFPFTRSCGKYCSSKTYINIDGVTEMKRILLISGSNRNGNINYLLRAIEKQIENTELILLSECNIEYCRGCLACHNIDKCIIQDDMKEIIDKMIETDLIVFGVPNYFDNVTGLFKNFMDRLHPLYKSELIKDKKVIFIYTGGGNAEGTKEKMQKAVYGFIKYLKLDVLEEYSYKALNLNDVEEQNYRINKMIKEIISIIKK